MPKGHITATDAEIIQAFKEGGFILQICRDLHVGETRCRKVLDAAGLRHGTCPVCGQPVDVVDGPDGLPYRSCSICDWYEALNVSQAAGVA